MRRLKAFTLLEVMVALLVIAIGLGAVIQASSSSTWQSGHIREKAIAGWVAQNQMAIFRAKRVWDSSNRKTGTAEMANIEWNFEITISATTDPSFRKIEIDVFQAEDKEKRVKAHLTGYMARL